jgi:hypothetical protein
MRSDRHSKRTPSFYFRFLRTVGSELRSAGPVSLRSITDLSTRRPNNILALTYLSIQRQQCDSYVFP